MKSLLFILAMLTSSVLTFGQQAKPNFSVEYSPALSRLTNQRGMGASDNFSLSHQIIVKTEKRFSKHWALTAGIGYLNTRNYSSIEADGFNGISTIGNYVNYNYVVLPIGIKYNIGSFFISPEIGFGVNLSPSRPLVKYIYEYTNGANVVVKSRGVGQQASSNPISFPLSMTIGKEVSVPYGTLMLGLRGYYSLESVLDHPFNNQHYIGFGALVGYKF